MSQGRDNAQPLVTPIRLIDAGLVSPVRSQTLYHALAYALDDTTPDTILLISSDRPYVSIGFHQEAEKEVDLAYCRAQDLPVVRREVGGGAVYLDRRQIFTQWIFHRRHLPADLAERFQLYARPLVETYHALGVNAIYRPINDIHVDGKKIGGTGAALIGEADVVVGSLMFDFDVAMMARVLKVSSEKMRDKLIQGLNDYMTTLTGQLGYAPQPRLVTDLYVDRCAAALGRSIRPGKLSDHELAIAAELDQRFASAEWLHLKGGLRQTGVKIHQDVRVVEAAYKAPGGLIRITARLRNDRIDDISFSGDFTILPSPTLGALERALIGLPLDTALGARAIEDVYQAANVQSPGVTPADFAQAIALLGQPRAGSP